jgi:hypothetical protein
VIGDTLTSIVWPRPGITPADLIEFSKVEAKVRIRHVREHPPRLILILGARNAKDQIKVRNLDQLDTAFATALARAALKGRKP